MVVEPQNIAFTWRFIINKTNPITVLLLNCSMVEVLRFFMLFMVMEEKAYNTVKDPNHFTTLLFIAVSHFFRNCTVSAT
jgi:hypothetical protein